MELKSLMDLILVSGRYKLKIYIPEIFSRTPVRGEARYYDHRAVKTQGSPGLRVDLVDIV